MHKYFLKKQFISLRIIGIVGLLVFATSCSNDSEETRQAEIKFTDYSPTSGSRETMLFLKGENFGTSSKNVKVWVNGEETKVINVSKNQINARVPAGVGSGAIKVSIDGLEYTYTQPFEYLPTYVVSTFAGTGQAGYVDGAVDLAQFQNLHWLTYDKRDDVIYTLETDLGQPRIRRVKNGTVETVVLFDGSHTTRLNNPRTIEFSVTGDTIFIGNDNANNPTANPHAVGVLLRSDDFKVVKPCVTYPMAGTPHVNFAGVNPVSGMLVYYCWPGKLYQWDKKTGQSSLLADVQPALGRDGSYGSARFSPDGKTIYLIMRNDYQGILSAEYNLDTKSIVGQFKPFAGTGTWGSNDGQGTAAGMDQPSQGFFAKDGNLYAVERFNHVVRRITPSGAVSMFAGSPGQGYANGDAIVAKFNQPLGFVVDKNNNMYVAEFGNNRIRIIKQD